MDEFEQYRPLLFSIAYQMLGSAMEAEDIVQETYLRYQSATDVESPKAYLTTITTRLCVNQLNSARERREQYFGEWLPEPLLTGDAASPLSPSVQFDRQETISMAFLVLMEQLTPPERAVFLLRDVFDYNYAEIAQILEREEADCRQLHSRAKKHLAEHRPRFHASPEQHRQMLERFNAAVQIGQVEALKNLLAQDAVLWVDGAGRKGAPTRPIVGRESISQFAQGMVKLLPEGYASNVEEVNGEPAVVVRVEGEPYLVMMAEIDEGQFKTLRAVASPDKLKRI
jgi:RNA polymerase sigma-70 factor (ECF subfamily)